MSANLVPAMKLSAQSEESVTRNYEEAINKLNTLQSNESALANSKENKRNDEDAKKKMKEVEDFLHRNGMKVEQLDDLSIIHVSGTKGKGSVCAMCESMLRASGFKTGFFSSPHLVEVRERIRINGRPLPRDVFTEYFTTVFDRLQETKEDYGGKMPAYFRFLTVLAFHVFLKEKVDVAVVEVGIGGSCDCTNVIRKPIVIGVASIGEDHIKFLGKTVEKRAWHKAAISKPGRPTFTVRQPVGATCMKVVKETAMGCGASSVECAPDFESYDFKGVTPRLGLAGEHQYTNASLALQLCKTWIENYQQNANRTECTTFQLTNVSSSAAPAAEEVGMATAKPFVVPPNFMRGLEDCYWPGRNQRVKRENVTYYIDGAHTPRSIQACQNWFMTAAKEECDALDRPIKRILIFNLTRDRNEYKLLENIIGCQFDAAAFCPNITGDTASGNSADQTVCAVTADKQLARCERNMVAFQKLMDDTKPADVPRTVTAVLPNITKALQWAASWADHKQNLTTEGAAPQKPHVQVLICGSLHLVGGVIKVLDPELVNRPAP